MSHLTPVPSDPDQLRAWLEKARNGVIDLPPAPRQPQLLTIKVTLADTEPAVWRRLVVAGDVTLDRLHEVLQVAMGWTDSHLHRFFIGSVPDRFFLTEFDIAEGETGTTEQEARLDQVLREPGGRIRYDYDFGDGWEHEVQLEGVGPIADDTRPRCIGGAMACPPEDVGGPPGYADVATWVRGSRRADAVPPQFESVERALAWVPRDWDPDDFDVEDCDLLLQSLSAGEELLEGLSPQTLEALGRLSALQLERVSPWLASAAHHKLTPPDVEELTRPYRQLLAVIGGGVELTASGYLRPTVVEELCRAFDIHPALAGRANRESNVRPLLLFRKGAQQLGLLHASGGLLMPTIAGITLGEDAEGLWRHLTQRIPAGRGELKRDVGWFTLLALAGGVDHHDVYEAVHELCVDSGWEEQDGTPIRPDAINPLVWPTLSAVVGPGWNSLRTWPRWVPAAAASLLSTGAFV